MDLSNEKILLGLSWSPYVVVTNSNKDVLHQDTTEHTASVVIYFFNN